MNAQSVAYVAAALLIGLVVAGKTFAGDKTSSAAEQAQEQTKVEVITGLMKLGEENKDPLMLTAAAKVLSGMKSGVADPVASKAEGKPVLYDASKIAEQAASLAGDDKGMLEQINVVRSNARAAGARYACWYEQWCDPYWCRWYYVCG